MLKAMCALFQLSILFNIGTSPQSVGIAADHAAWPGLIWWVFLSIFPLLNEFGERFSKVSSSGLQRLDLAFFSYVFIDPNRGPLSENTHIYHL